MKIRRVGAELFHADRRTDMTNLIIAFRYVVNAPKKYYVLPTHCMYVFRTDLRTNSDYFPTQH